MISDEPPGQKIEGACLDSGDNCLLSLVYMMGGKVRLKIGISCPNLPASILFPYLCIHEYGIGSQQYSLELAEQRLLEIYKRPASQR